VNSGLFAQNKGAEGKKQHKLRTVKVDRQEKRADKKEGEEKVKKAKIKEKKKKIHKPNGQERYSIDKNIKKSKKKNEEGRGELDKKHKPKNVAYRDSLDAQVKRKIKEAKKHKKLVRKTQKKIDYAHELGQSEQPRVYKKIRRGHRKSKRLNKGKNPDPWYKRWFRKKRTYVKKKKEK
jgi:hypothetical protein